MNGRGLARRGNKNPMPFHERHKFLLVLCSVAGLHVRAVDRIITTKWKHTLLRCWSLFVHAALTSVFIGSLLHLFFKKKNAFQTIHAILLLGTSAHGSLRQFYMHKYIDKFDELYTTWDELFGEDDDWKSRQKSFDKNYSGAKKVIVSLGVVTTVLLTIYTLAHLGAKEKVVVFPTIIPYRRQSPDFEILVLYFVFAVFWHGIAVGSSQMLLVLPILWELGEMNRLQEKLEEILVNGESIREEVTTRDGAMVRAKTYTTQGVANISKKMKVWVHQHQKVTKFHKMSTYLNNFELSMEMVATFLEAIGMAILCSTDFYTRVHQMTTIGSFIAYFALFYYSCAKCNELADVSMAVADDAFAENWSALPVKLKKNFLIILARTLKPFNYYGAYIFRIDRITFMKIIQTSYSVFNVFFTIVRKD